MNKLLGFYELKDSVLPTIPWKEFNKDVRLDSNVLWTVRSAVYRGEDLNLPRAVGVSASEAYVFASDLLDKMQNKGIVVYYPYFLAEKSGNINIFSNKIVIEAVKEDLWNLVTYADRDVTIEVIGDSVLYNGDEKFISQEEFEKLLYNARRAKQMFRDELLEGKSAMLEWSFAYPSDLDKKRSGQKYLVFYEARTI